jgi:hypothetical protein
VSGEASPHRRTGAPRLPHRVGVTIRHREPTRDELIELLWEKTGVLREVIDSVLTGIGDLSGRVVDVKIEVEEDTA